MGDNSHFFGKSVNMLGFFLKERQRNKHWEIAVFMFGFFDFFIKNIADAFPDAVSPRLNNHTSGRGRILGHIGFADNILIPLRIITGSCVF